MRISPEAFIEEQKDKSYEELLAVRDKLIGVIKDFEEEAEKDPEDVLVYPSPDGNYYCNLKLLAELCRLITDKYDENAAGAAGK